ncbi:MAG TPA: cyanophycinase [Puia sp.]
MKKHFLVVLILLAYGHAMVAQRSPITVKSSVTRHGPERGSLIIIGGGGSTPEIWKKFTELAGGKEKAKVVFVTNGTPGADTSSRSYVNVIRKETGIQDIAVLNAHNLAEANSESFIAPLRTATAVFFDGGRQWRIADAYLNTLAHQAFLDVLDRGGVIIGSSAGATIQGSFLWRGDTRNNSILVGDHTQGLGFLKNSVIDQHLLARNREFDLVDFIKNTPELIGIGLDQATAILVQRDTLEVIGKTYAVIYDYNTIKGASKHVVDGKEDYTASSGPFFLLGQGQRYDLKNRKVIVPPAREGGAGSDGDRATPPSATSPIEVKKSTTKHGPEKGSLLIIGGNVGSTASIWEKFTELAGGKDKAHVVVVTTASGDSAAFDKRDVEEVKKQTGIKDVVLLHTTDLREANSEKFIAPIKRATGVYFVGGRQWRIADAYLNTLTHQAFLDLLDRGGVIAGSSAGASIQGSFLWRGDTKGAEILIGDHTQGLGFLRNSAIDQHLLRRNREFDLATLIRKAPELLGIGLDEATAVWVQRDTLQVIGKSYVAIYDYNTIVADKNPFFFLSDGQKYDLANRKVIQAPRRQGVQPE